jgi:hypothetical protein
MFDVGGRLVTALAEVGARRQRSEIERSAEDFTGDRPGACKASSTPLPPYEPLECRSRWPHKR